MSTQILVSVRRFRTGIYGMEMEVEEVSSTVLELHVMCAIVSPAGDATTPGVKSLDAMALESQTGMRLRKTQRTAL